MKKSIKGIKKNIKKTFVASALTTATLMSAITACRNEINISQDKNIVGILKGNIKLPVEMPTYQKVLQDEVKCLETPEDVLKDMKERYVQAYNKINEENITLENLKLVKSSQNYVIKTKDGRYFTHGDTPIIISDALEQEGIEYETIEDVKVYKSLINDKILEQMLSNGTPVFDGNDISNIKKNNDENTLSKFCDVFENGLEYMDDMSEVRLQNYVDSLIKFYYGDELGIQDKSNQNEEDYEIGD